MPSNLQHKLKLGQEMALFRCTWLVYSAQSADLGMLKKVDKLISGELKSEFLKNVFNWITGVF